MRHPVPAEVLKSVRESGGISQATLSKSMGTVASVLSKLEKTDEVEAALADRYLEAVGSDLGKQVREFYGRSWLHTPPPSYLHPDREILWIVEDATEKLAQFEKSDNNHPILRGPIDLLKTELASTAGYLRRRDHNIAWVGDIGVGKTTALAHAVDLLIGDGRGQKKPAFPVGSGRTTICETAIKVATTFGVSVDALEDEEVVRLVRDLVSSLMPSAAGVGVPSEVSRTLRNMANMKISRVQIGEDEFESIDPIVGLLKEGLARDEAVDRVVASLKLSDRKERQLILPEGSVDGLAWLSALVSKINNGQEERFSVPRRITVLMPSANLSAEGQLLSVVDTRGVEGVTQRADLTTHRDDIRTLMVLCTKFADAPGQSTLRHLEDARETGSDAFDRDRLCILVLPRGDEASQLPGLDEPLSSRAEGYAIRKQDINQALTKAKVPIVPVYFFDAHNDKPAKIWASLRGQVTAMRSTYSKRILTAADGVTNLIENVDIVKTSEARRAIEVAIDRLINEFISKLPRVRRPAHQNLLDQFEAGHHSSVAASMVRGGEWPNFPISHILGTGVRIDANLRTQEHLMRVQHKLEELSSEYRELPDVVQSLSTIGSRLNEQRQEFLSSALAIGRDAYGSLLSREKDVWMKSEARYGGGSGYKRDVANVWRGFFETSAADDTISSINSRLRKSWHQNILSPLRASTRAEFLI